MATRSNVIPVPATERGAYNPNRPAGKLLQSQALHLREALLKHLAELTAIIAISPQSLKTEGDIGNYIARATAILHTRSAKPFGK
jgi:hypothetical protein